jgi:purine nucleosidase
MDSMRVILDTDIGTDVDDCLALAFILASPEFKLEGVTCIYGDTLLRARMVMKLLRLRGVEGIPVMGGVHKPLMGIRPVYWEGHEGQGLLEEEDKSLIPSPEFAPDFIARIATENPGQIHLICIDPQTNAALAFLREPKLDITLAHVTVMGGVIRSPDRLDLPYAEHNIVCDPEAAQIVLSSNVPTTIVPLDITTQVRITRKGLDRIRAAGTPFHEAVARQLELYPRFARQGWTNMHDPLAVATLLRPDLVTLHPVQVDVETGGRLAAGATLMRSLLGERSTVRVATSVNIQRAQRFIVSRLES